MGLDRELVTWPSVHFGSCAQWCSVLFPQNFASSCNADARTARTSSTRSGTGITTSHQQLLVGTRTSTISSPDCSVPQPNGSAYSGAGRSISALTLPATGSPTRGTTAQNQPECGCRRQRSLSRSSPHSTRATKRACSTRQLASPNSSSSTSHADPSSCTISPPGRSSRRATCCSSTPPNSPRHSTGRATANNQPRPQPPHDGGRCGLRQRSGAKNALSNAEDSSARTNGVTSAS